METGESTGSESTASTLGCEHYRRKCKLISPCCKNNYFCRFCHDASESHPLERRNITEVECQLCSTRQQLSQTCNNEQCSTVFGKYFCAVCPLYDDEDKQQFHCDGCGLCRVGGRDNFFHCKNCNMCLPIGIEANHKCVIDASRSNCAVCMEDIHTSRIKAHVPSCGHLIHHPCFSNLVTAGHFACPTCGQSLLMMSEMWESLQQEIDRTPMPEDYRNLYCKVLCKDCHKECIASFHIIGHRCKHCHSFNTVRTKGGLLKRVVRNDATGGEPGNSEGCLSTASAECADSQQFEEYIEEEFSDDET